MKDKRPRLVMVEWTDSCAPSGGWVRVEDLAGRGPMRCTTVGFLIDEGPGYKTVAGSVTEGEETPLADGCMTIPTSAIQRVRRLPTPRRKKRETP